MTHNELAPFIGRTGNLPVEGGQLTIPVRVVDAMVAYGNPRFLVEPSRGNGSKWVDAVRVTFGEDAR